MTTAIADKSGAAKFQLIVQVFGRRTAPWILIESGTINNERPQQTSLWLKLGEWKELELAFSGLKSHLRGLLENPHLSCFGYDVSGTLGGDMFVLDGEPVLVLYRGNQRGVFNTIYLRESSLIVLQDAAKCLNSTFGVFKNYGVENP